MGYDMYLVEPAKGVETLDDDSFKALEERYTAYSKRYWEITKEHGFDSEEAEALNAENADWLEHWHQAVEAKQLAESGYFRLNVWGMGKAREAMERLGMLDLKTKTPDWPDPEKYGIGDRTSFVRDGDESAEAPKILNTWDEYYNYTSGWGNLSDVDESVPVTIRNFWKSQYRALSYTPPSITGICIFKLCSNDGWIVTARECEAAVKAWETWRDNRIRRSEEGRIEELLKDAPWWESWIDYLEHAAAGAGFRVY